MTDTPNTAPADPPAWITVPELAAEIRTPEATLRYWRNAGLGPKSTKLGRRILYRRTDVDAWISAMEAAQNPPRRLDLVGADPAAGGHGFPTTARRGA